MFVVRCDNAVLYTVLQNVLAEVDYRITSVDDVIDKTLHLAAVIQTREQGENNLVVTHMGLA